MSQKLLKWSSHRDTLLETFYSYYVKEEMTDTTLHFQDGKINVHKIILSACSATFERILKESRTSEIYFCDVLKSSMSYLIEFMYKGHALVPSDALAGVLRAAEYFQVKGIQTANGSQNSPSQLLITSNNLQKEQNGQATVVKRRYGLPSSPIRRDRPRHKNTANNSIMMSTPIPEGDKVPFRSSGNTKSDDTSADTQNTSDILSTSPVRKATPTKRISPVIKEESRSNTFPRMASQLSSNSKKCEKSSRKTKTTHIEETSEGSSSKRTKLIDRKIEVVNPFAKRATILESPDSDITFIDAPVANKEINTKGAMSSEMENDLEILVVEDTPIEVMESLAEPTNSVQGPESDPDSDRDSYDKFESACALSNLELEPCVIQSKNTEAGASSRKAHQPGRNFSSTDEDVPCSTGSKQSKASRKIKDKKKKVEFENEVIIKKPPPDRSTKMSQKQLEKYTRDLMTKPLTQMHDFCPLCFEYIEDIKGHIKIQHKKMPRDKGSCKLCKKEFFNKKFFHYHKCIQKKD